MTDDLDFAPRVRTVAIHCECDTPLTAGVDRWEPCASCGNRDDLCSSCSEPLVTFDPTLRMTTCGGFAIVGALVCSCGSVELSNRSASADAVDWRPAKGGRSITAGGIKLRAEGGTAEQIGRLMERLLTLPALEVENERLRGQLARRAP